MLLLARIQAQAEPIQLTGPIDPQFFFFGRFFSAEFNSDPVPLDIPLDGQLVSVDFLFPTIVQVPVGWTLDSFYGSGEFQTRFNGFPYRPGEASTGRWIAVGPDVDVDVVTSGTGSDGTIGVGIGSYPPPETAPELQLAGLHLDVYVPNMSGHRITEITRIRVGAVYVPEPSSFSLLIAAGLVLTLLRLAWSRLHTVGQHSEARGPSHW